MKRRIFAAAMFAVASLAATSAYAYDVTELRDSPAADAPGTLQSRGFRFVGTYDEIDNQWKVWFNRGSGECVGYTQKGRKVSRAKSFNNDRCREAGGGGGRHDRDDHYGPPPGGGYDGHDGDRGHDRYDNDVPRWMTGSFRGYNRDFGAAVTLDISRDGDVVATANGNRMDGRIRDGVLRIGPNRFTIDRDDDGLTTRQIGNDRNMVRYRRR